MSVIQQCMRSHSTLPLTDLLWVHTINYRLHGALNHSSSDSFFLPFLLFDQWYFTCSGEAEMKALQRSRQAHFLVASSPDSFPAESFALCHLRTIQRRVCSQDSLSETRSIPDHFMWGDPLPGFSASYIETCYCSMLPACSRLSKVGWAKKS